MCGIWGRLYLLNNWPMLGTAETGALAKILGCEERTARWAGLLQDSARGWPAEDLLAFAQKHELAVDNYCLEQPVLLHAPVGAVLAKEQWGIEDEEILKAIAHHTLGSPGMTVLAQIIYLADKLSPTGLIRVTAFFGTGRFPLPCHDCSQFHCLSTCQKSDYIPAKC